MPRKNPDREDLNSYKVHFVNKEKMTVHTPDNLITEIGKDDDEGGFHPVIVLGDEIMLNLNNIYAIENITKPPEHTKV